MAGTDLAGLAKRLLRGHAGGSAQDVPLLGQVLRIVDRLGQSEVGHLGFSIFRQQDVGGLQVAVNDAVLMHEVNGLGHGAQQLGRSERRVRAGLQVLAEGAARHVFEDAVQHVAMLAQPEDFHHVGVFHTGDGLDATTGPTEGLGGRLPVSQYLQGHQAVQIDLPCLVDHAHPSPAQFLQHLEAGNLGHGQRRGNANLANRGNPFWLLVVCLGWCGGVQVFELLDEANTGPFLFAGPGYRQAQFPGIQVAGKVEQAFLAGLRTPPGVPP